MADKYFNPFSNIDIFAPTEYRDDFDRYCFTSGNTTVDLSPFPRRVDMWFAAICIAAKKGLEPKDVRDTDGYKFIDGSIFNSDPWRVNALMLLAIGAKGDVDVVCSPREVIDIANGFAFAGIPLLIEMLQDPNQEPLWNALDGFAKLLHNGSADG